MITSSILIPFRSPNSSVCSRTAFRLARGRSHFSPESRSKEHVRTALCAASSRCGIIRNATTTVVLRISSPSGDESDLCREYGFFLDVVVRRRCQCRSRARLEFELVAFGPVEKTRSVNPAALIVLFLEWFTSYIRQGEIKIIKLWKYI